MPRRGRVSVALLALILAVTGCAEAPRPSPAGQLPRDTLPLADLHFHPGFTLSPREVLEAMDRAGVRSAGTGPKGSDHVWLHFVQAAPDRFIPFAGQGTIFGLIRDLGEAAWTLKSPEIVRYLATLEADLKSGRFRGIGELFVNNLNTHPPTFQGIRYPADSPLMRRLLALAATH